MLGSHVDECRALLILHDDIDRRRRRHANGLVSQKGIDRLGVEGKRGLDLVQELADAPEEEQVEQLARTVARQQTAIDLLTSYHWPGNVRELENTIERAVLLTDGEVIHGHHLPPTLQSAEATGTVVSTSLGTAVEAFERSLIEDALKSSRGNRSKAARLLSTTERVISYKAKKYGIDPARLRG